MNFWLYKKPWKTLTNPYGSCKVMPFCIIQLKSSIFFTNISMLVLLPWIIERIWKMTWISFHNWQNWFLGTFFRECVEREYLIDQIYHQNMQTAFQKEKHISAACKTIPAAVLSQLSANFVPRLHYAVIRHDGYIENILFCFLWHFLHVHTVFLAVPLIIII